MTAIIWSKDQCPHCVQAKSLLQMKNIKFEERNLSNGGWTKEQLLEEAPTARSVPQIKIDGVYIGGFSELQQYLKANYDYR